MIKDFVNNKGNYIINFENFSGSGWDDILQKILEKKLNPIEISKRIISQSWDYSEIEFDVKKDNIEFIIHLEDDLGDYMKLISGTTEENKQKLREWAMIISTEIEKLKKK